MPPFRGSTHNITERDGSPERMTSYQLSNISTSGQKAPNQFITRINSHRHTCQPDIDRNHPRSYNTQQKRNCNE